MIIRVFGYVILLCHTFSWVFASNVAVSQFDSQGLKGWTFKSFLGNTSYQLVEGPKGKIIYADANASASGMYKKIKIDLRRTPYLNWRWKIKKFPGSSNERSKQGDDFAARVYVVVSGGIRFWQTKAVNYVWSEHVPAGKFWHNPFSNNALMISQQSGKKQVGQWVTEKRNIREDLHLHLGRQINFVDAIAIMTDSDNTKGRAQAWYGEIFFSEN